MSNKWAESHGGYHEHNERQYYATLGINPYDFSDEPNDGQEYDYIEEAEWASRLKAAEDYRSDSVGTLILVAFIMLVLVLI